MLNDSTIDDIQFREADTPSTRARKLELLRLKAIALQAEIDALAGLPDPYVPTDGTMNVTGNGAFSGTLTASNLSGTNTGDQFTAMTSSRFLGRVTAGFGAAEQLTGTQATALLDVASGAAKGLMSAADFTLLGTISGNYVTTNSAQSITAIKSFTSSGNIAAANTASNLEAWSNSVTDGAWITFHRSGFYAIHAGLDTDNSFKIGGFSSPLRFALTAAGNGVFEGDVEGVDFKADRGDGTGVIFLGGAHYLYYTGAFYQMPSAELHVNGGYALRHLDGARARGGVTISSAAPSGGSDGDIWLKI
jgi:hypothetical protein